MSNKQEQFKKETGWSVDFVDRDGLIIDDIMALEYYEKYSDWLESLTDHQAQRIKQLEAERDEYKFLYHQKESRLKESEGLIEEGVCLINEFNGTRKDVNCIAWVGALGRLLDWAERSSKGEE